MGCAVIEESVLTCSDLVLSHSLSRPTGVRRSPTKQLLIQSICQEVSWLITGVDRVDGYLLLFNIVAFNIVAEMMQANI